MSDRWRWPLILYDCVRHNMVSHLVLFGSFAVVMRESRRAEEAPRAAWLRCLSRLRSTGVAANQDKGSNPKPAFPHCKIRGTTEMDHNVLGMYVHAPGM